MCIHVSHLVLVAFCHTNDEVVDEGFDRAQGCDILSAAVVEFDVDDVLFGVGEADREMLEVLDELASWAFDCDDTGLDVDFDCYRTLSATATFHLILAL